MTLRWSRPALADLERLYSFLISKSERAAADSYLELWSAPEQLLRHPRIGPRLMTFNPREVRRLFIGKYEMRYEIRAEEIRILRIWNVREDR